MGMQILAEKCIGCGACAKDCTRQIIQMQDHRAWMADEENCNLCGHCYSICPVEAVTYPDDILDGSEEIPTVEGRLDPRALLRAIKSRRSVRYFKKEPVEDEKIRQIIEAARFTPSGANIQTTDFLVIRDRLPEITADLLNQMKEAALHPETTDTPLLPHYGDKWIEMERLYREEQVDRLFYHAQALLVMTGTDLIDTALAASSAELMVNALGLGCVYIGFCRYVMNTPRSRELLGIPEGQEEICCLAIGYPDVHYRRTAPRRRRDIRYL